MSFQHQNLASGKWLALSLPQQLANIGSEVFRAISSRERKDEKSAELAFDRALELFDFTLQDRKNQNQRLKEIARARETFVDYFKFTNQYCQNKQQINDYFMQFNYLARIGT